MTSIDVAAAHEEQRRIWDDVSEGWARWQPAFERGAGAVTAELLRLGGVAPGQRVLDFGTGLGEPAVSAALAVAPDGLVLGVDLSPRMIELARARAAGPVEFVAGDLDDLGLPAGGFDVVLSRWALPFLPDRVGTLRTLHRLLKPGGVLAAAVWGTPPRVPMISLAFAVVARLLELPPAPPGLPGPFALADADLARAELAEAGFGELAVTTLGAEFRLGSLDEFAGFARDVLPPRMKQLLRDRYGTVAAPAVWTAFTEAAAPFATGDGVVVPSETLCLRAVAGAR
ncbi:class I SAM-dependent methyltransferase [Amycolatopsis sp. NBC_00345]|uniref:class I SAM-dependent methyltransferase n=1 Tax=Amycolatopsis sp. NBC_00345 TaxID=2975955 RepID=UPI002E26A906